MKMTDKELQTAYRRLNKRFFDNRIQLRVKYVSFGDAEDCDGADGIVLFGYSTEFMHLTVPECDRMLRVVVDTCAGRIPVIPSVTRTTPAEAVDDAAAVRLAADDDGEIPGDQCGRLGVDADIGFIEFEESAGQKFAREILDPFGIWDAEFLARVVVLLQVVNPDGDVVVRCQPHFIAEDGGRIRFDLLVDDLQCEVLDLDN